MRRLASLLLVAVMILTIIPASVITAFAGEPCAEHKYVASVTTPATLSAEGEMTYTCSECGDTYTEAIPVVQSQRRPTIDGNVGEGAWKDDEWVEVNTKTGFWQALPTTDTLSFKYQITTDEKYLYVAAVIDAENVDGKTKIRLWLNTDTTATVYTHFYDVYTSGGALATVAKYNKSKTGNDGAVIDGTTLDAAFSAVAGSGKTVFEFKVELAEFNGANGFSYYICAFNKVNEDLCLFYPPMEAGASRLDNLPYKKWDFARDAEQTTNVLPEGAYTIDNVGYRHENGFVQILAGDDMTVGQLTNLGAGQGEKDLNYNYTYVVNQYGIVTEAHEALGRDVEGGVKTSVVCPKGGFIIAYHGNLTKPDIKVGYLVTLYNIDPDLFRGVAGYQLVTAAGFTAVDHKHEFTNKVTIPATLAKEGEVRMVCSCGTYEVKEVLPVIKAQKDQGEYENLASGKSVTATTEGNYYTDLTDGVLSNTVSWTAGEWCNPKGDNTMTLDLGEVKAISNARVHMLWNDDTSGICNAKNITVEVSEDGTTYTEVANENYPRATGVVGWKPVWLAYSFDEVSARYVRFTVTKYTNFTMFDEIEVFGKDAPSAIPPAAIAIDYAGYKHASFVSIVAGDNMTVAELTALGNNGAAKDMNYAKNIVVNKDGIVVGTYFDIGTGHKEVVCPEGGYVISYNYGKAGAAVMDDINVGSIITLGNVDVEAMRGVADNQELKDAWFTYTRHNFHKYAATVTKAPTLVEEGTVALKCIYCGDEKTGTAPIPQVQRQATIDGFIIESAWDDDAWITVNDDNGFYQSHGKGPSAGGCKIAFKYQMFTNGEYLFVAVVFEGEDVAGGNGNGTNVRLWLHNDDQEATVYTHFYDAFLNADGTVGTVAKYNTSKTTNAAKNIEGSGMTAGVSAETTQTKFEMKIPLAEFGGLNGFSYHLTVSNKENGYANSALYYPAVTPFEKEDGSVEINYYLPTSHWAFDVTPEMDSGVLPEGATVITRAGYEHVTGQVQILAGDGEMTIGELVAQYLGEAKDLNAHYTYVVDQYGIVVKEFEKLGRPDGVKTDEVVPEGCYVLAVHQDVVDCTATINVGTLITLYNVDMEALRGQSGFQVMTAAGFTAEAHEHNFVYPVVEVPTLAKEGRVVTVCEVCGTPHIEKTPRIETQDSQEYVNLALNCTEEKLPYEKDPTKTYNTCLTDGVVFPTVSYDAGNWYAVHASNSTDNVGVINLTLGEAKELANVRIYFLSGNASGIQTPEKVKIEVSADGTTYNEVASESYDAPDPDGESLKAAWHYYSFNKVSAKYIRVSVTKRGTFSFLNEIEVYGEAAPQPIPDDAFMLGYAGLYFSAGASCLLAGLSTGDTTLGELVALGDGESNPLTWWGAIVCDKDGKIVKANSVDDGSVSKDAYVVPKGGFAVVVHCDSMNALFESFKEGQIVTVHNVKLNVMRGAKDSQSVTNAYITVADAPVVEPYEAEVNVNEQSILTDGTINVDGNWGSGAGTDNVLLITNTKCKEAPMNVTVLYALGATKKINSVTLDFYHCAGVMIGYPEGQAEVFVSTDGTNYTSVGKFDFADADVASGKYGTVANKFSFNAVDAAYIKVTFSAGSNEDVLGPTPADDKIYWEFVALTEVEVGEESAPEFPVGDIDGDGEVTITDYLMVKATVLGTKEFTEEQKARMDVIEDGEINIFDYLQIKKIVLEQ